MAKENTAENQAKRVEELFDLYPIYLGEPKATTMAMRESLARMYGDNAMRGFLENAVRYANRRLIASSTIEHTIFYKSRIETILQLLSMGKQHFIHSEMRRVRGEALKAVEKDVTEVILD